MRIAATEAAANLPEYDLAKWDYVYGGKKGVDYSNAWLWNEFNRLWATPPADGDYLDGIYRIPRYPHPDAVAATLAERQTTHGDFKDNARIFDHFLQTIRLPNTRFWNLSADERCALIMNWAKDSRVLSPKAKTNPDDWRDKAGYSTLAERSLSDA